MKLLVLTFCDSNIIDYTIYTMPIMTNWCKKNQFAFKMLNNRTCEDKHASWEKIIMLQKALQKDLIAKQYDYILFLDADIIINKIDFNPLDYIDDVNHIYMSLNNANGGHVLNGGSILIKTGTKGLDFINLIIHNITEESKWRNFYEQGVIDKLLPTLKYVKQLPMRALNSWWLDDKINAPDNNLYHFMGRNLEDKIKYCKQHLNL